MEPTQTSPLGIAMSMVRGSRAGMAESINSVRLARSVRWLGRVLIAGLIALPVGLVFIPWRQHLTGRGQLSALRPLDRPQPVEAPISGRVKEWLVQEGSKVKKGQVLFRIQDQDQDRLGRLEEQRRNILAKLEAKLGQIQNLNTTVAELRLTRDSLIAAIQAEIDDAKLRVQAAEQKLRSTQLKRDFVSQALQARRALLAKQLEARLKVQEVQADLAIAEAEVLVAKAGKAGAEATVREKNARMAATRAKENAAIEKALGDIAEKESEAEDIKKELQEQDTKIARQKSQEAVAPGDGTVFQLVGGQGGRIVKEGDRLLTFVPDNVEIVAELFVTGNDAPLVKVGDPVRLQFEGWPAVQSVGWPSTAIGTFGGVVALVDPADDGQGRFRILVKPDPKDDLWPAPAFLRQGVRTKGWVLLKEVSIGWEVWRQLNGFPPITRTQFLGTPDSKKK